MTYSLKKCSDYFIDKWYKKLQDWDIGYCPVTTYKLIKFSQQDIRYFLKKKQFSEHLKKELETLFPGEYFFKLSHRSPKDILEKKIKINNSDHRTTKLEKKRKQLAILKVVSVENILELLLKSKRTREDLKLCLRETVDIHLVFQPWRPSTGTEYRCFINRRKLVGICLYKPEYYSSRTVIPVGLIQEFISKLFERIDYEKFVVDIFENDSRIYFIEINPFEEFLDTFSFEWDIISNSNTLLVTI